MTSKEKIVFMLSIRRPIFRTYGYGVLAMGVNLGWMLMNYQGQEKELVAATLCLMAMAGFGYCAYREQRKIHQLTQELAQAE